MEAVLFIAQAAVLKSVQDHQGTSFVGAVPVPNDGRSQGRPFSGTGTKVFSPRTFQTEPTVSRGAHHFSVDVV